MGFPYNREHHLADRGVKGKIILKYILENNYELWIGFVSLRTRFTSGFQ